MSAWSSLLAGPWGAGLAVASAGVLVAAGVWLRGRPEIRDGPAGLLGGSKGAELALLAAAAYPESFGPVAAIAPAEAPPMLRKRYLPFNAPIASG